MRAMLRDARLAKGLSHERLGREVDASRNTIGDIERGRHTPRVDLARRIASALDSDVETLFGEVSDTRVSDASLPSESAQVA